MADWLWLLWAIGLAAGLGRNASNTGGAAVVVARQPAQLQLAAGNGGRLWVAGAVGRAGAAAVAVASAFDRKGSAAGGGDDRWGRWQVHHIVACCGRAGHTVMEAARQAAKSSKPKLHSSRAPSADDHR